MKWWDCISLAVAQISRRKQRAFLCALSVGVGMASMLCISAVGKYGQAEVQQAVEQLGLGGLAVYTSGSTSQPLTAQQAQSLARTLPVVDAAMAIKAQTGTYRTARSSGSVVFLGISEQAASVMDIQLTEGTLPNNRQVQHAERVAVIDTSFAEKAYGRQSVVGKTLRITMDGVENRYRIIGVMQPQAGMLGAALGGIVPTLIYLPYSCLAGKQDSADQIFVQCSADPDIASQQILHYLSRKGYAEDSIGIQNLDSTVALVKQLAEAVTLAFLAIAAIAFAVAMLGVTNGMLSATTEKTAEIGLYMALGAQQRDVAKIFLAQAVLTCFLGGLGGICLAGMLLWGASALTQLPLGLSVAEALRALALSAFFGALSGVFPAYKAARLHPVESIRHM